MSGELGLANSFRNRVYEPLQRLRGTDGIGGLDISLIDFLQTRAENEDGRNVGLKNTSGKPIQMDDLWCDLGMDPSKITLDHLLGTSNDMRYLTPELIRDFIDLGLRADLSYTDLVAGTENSGSLIVTSPWIKTDKDTNLDTGEAETVAESDIVWGDKSVRLTKKAKALTLSDELILSTPLNLLSYFLQRFGTMLAASTYVDGVNTLIHGDQASGVDSCAVIGVEDKTQKTQFADFLRAWIRARRLAMSWTNMINNEATAFEILQINEFFKPQGFGTTVVTLDSKNRVVPSEIPHLIGSPLADGQTMLFDKSQAMIYLVFRGLLVENERIMMRQLNGTACSIIGGYSTVNRLARVILDETLAYSDNPFPSWMAPLI
jgi:hypothetical protein